MYARAKDGFLNASLSAIIIHEGATLLFPIIFSILTIILSSLIDHSLLFLCNRSQETSCHAGTITPQ